MNNVYRVTFMAPGESEERYRDIMTSSPEAASGEVKRIWPGVQIISVAVAENQNSFSDF